LHCSSFPRNARGLLPLMPPTHKNFIRINAPLPLSYKFGIRICYDSILRIYTRL
jgi:hypothetical protein